MQYFWLVNKWLMGRPELLLLLVLGGLFRLIGIYPGYYAHGDEVMYGEAVYMLINKTLGMESQFLWYPPLVAWIMLFFFLIFFIPLTIVGKIFAGNIDFDNFTKFFNSDVLGQNWVNAMYWGRYVTTFFSIGVIFLTYLLSYKLFKNRLIAFLSSFFVAVNYRLVLNSHVGFLDIYNVFFLLLSLLAISILLARQTFKTYLFAWISVALLFLVKYQIYSLITIVLVQILISCKSGKSVRGMLKMFFNKYFIMGEVIVLVMIIIAHFYHWQNWEKVVSLNQYQALKYGAGINTLNIFPLAYFYHVGVGPILSLAFITGLGLGVLKKEYRQSWILLPSLLVAGFLYLYFTRGGFYTRNFLAILPVIFIFASLSFVYLWNKFSVMNHLLNMRLLFLTSLIFLIFLSVKDQINNSIIVDKILSKVSNKVAMQSFIDKNLPSDVFFAGHPNSPSLQNNQTKLKNLQDSRMFFSLREFLDEGLDYALVDFDVLSNDFVWWMGVSPDIGVKFWNKPDNLLSQSYTALATRELLWTSTVKAYLPQWQIPGYSYALIKVNKQEKLKDLEPVVKYNFNTGEEGWQKLYFFPTLQQYLEFNGPGEDNVGSLMISKGANLNLLETKKYFKPGTIRWQSPVLEVDGLHGYQITGLVKNEENLTQNIRNGFIRLDFYSERKQGTSSAYPGRTSFAYQNKPSQSLIDRPIISFVSERVWGESRWQPVEIQAIAPEGTKFMTVDFQSDFPVSNLFLDMVEIKKTKDTLPDEASHVTIPDEDFFGPNDGGFL